MKDNPVAKNAHKFNKSQVMKDRKKAEKKGYRKHKGKMDEKLSAKDDAGEWVKDFRKSDAPQFKGKSDKKKQKMAIAAYLDAKDDDNTQKEFFGRLAAVGLGAFLQKKKEQKVDHPKAKSNLGLWDHKDHSMEEWACNQTERTRRVKGGDKRKKYMKEKQAKLEIEEHSDELISLAAQYYLEEGIDLDTLHDLTEDEFNDQLRWIGRHAKAAAVAGARATYAASKTVAKDAAIGAGRGAKAAAKMAGRGIKYGANKAAYRVSRAGRADAIERKANRLVKKKKDIARLKSAQRKLYKAKMMEGKEKGLWDNIHAKRKRGEKPAKPGEKGYPKTLDVGEGLAQARKNVGSDKCWDGYKATGTKMKNGKEVPDCKKEDVQQVDEVITKALKKAGSAAVSAAQSAAIDPKAHAAINTAKGMAKDTASDIKKAGAAAKKVPGAVKTGAKKVGSAAKTAAKVGNTNVRDLAKGNVTGKRQYSGGPPKPAPKTNAPKPKKANESMDPRDFTDKAGYVVTIKRKGGKEEIKNFFNTKPAAQKYADRVKNTNKVGHVATIYKTDGRKLMKESTAGIEMKSVSTMLDELTKRDLERMEKRKKTNLVKRGKAKPEPKKPQKKDVSAGRTASKEGEDDHIVMQLRKAQDVKGNMDIKVSPTGKTVKLPIKMIDKLLATHDKLQKPDEKRKFRIMVTKELRKRAK